MTSQTKTAHVTGGNKGIGFAICQGLLNEGFEVLQRIAQQSETMK